MFAEAIVELLKIGGIEPVYFVPVSVLVDSEPIVVSEGELASMSDIPLGRRLSVVCAVTVCRESLATCESVAMDCFTCLDSVDWTSKSDLGKGFALCGFEAIEPAYKGRDSSGRWLYTLKVTLTVERTSDDTEEK